MATKEQDMLFGYPSRDLPQGQTIPVAAAQATLRADQGAAQATSHEWRGTVQTIDSGREDEAESPPASQADLDSLRAQYLALQGRLVAVTGEVNQLSRTTATHDRALQQVGTAPAPTDALPTRAEILRARLMDLSNPAFLVMVSAAIISFVATLPQHGLNPNISYIVGGAFGIVYVAAKFLASMQGQSNMDKVLRATRTRKDDA